MDLRHTAFVLASTLPFLIFSTGCMHRPPPDLMSLPAPPFGREGTFNGQYNARTRQAIQSARGDFEGKYGNFAYPMRRDFLLDEGVTWGQIEAFYDSSFAQPTLSGFTRQDAVSPHPGQYRIAIWSENDKSILAVMVPGKSGDPLQFMYLFDNYSSITQ